MQTGSKCFPGSALKKKNLICLGGSEQRPTLIPLQASLLKWWNRRESSRRSREVKWKKQNWIHKSQENRVSIQGKEFGIIKVWTVCLKRGEEGGLSYVTCSLWGFDAVFAEELASGRTQKRAPKNKRKGQRWRSWDIEIRTKTSTDRSRGHEDWSLDT